MQLRTRWDRGVAIAKTGGQIRRVNLGTCLVKSQTTPGMTYTLTRTDHGWDCTCLDDVPFCKHVWALEYKSGDKGRAERGLALYRAGQVQKMGDGDYRIKSRRSDILHEVKRFSFGWACSCPDHLETLADCKHICAVQFECGERHIIERPDQTLCKLCDSPNIIRKGTQSGRPRFLCRSCGKFFTDNLGFEGMRNSPEHIVTAVDLVFSGLSTRKAANSVGRMGCKASHVSVYRWAESYGRLMETYLDMVRPHVGEMWRTDEVYMKIRGDRKYLFAMLDAKTRYWIARQVATHKGTDDVRPLFIRARVVAGKVPSLLISDGAPNFGEAHHDEYAPKNYLCKDSRHEPHIRLDGDPNNNQMESFNGNTIRMREKVTRGLKKEDSAILSGLQTYHNHVRPHLGLPDGQTPGEAAGIHVEGEDGWLTIILAAAKSKAKAESAAGA